MSHTVKKVSDITVPSRDVTHLFYSVLFVFTILCIVVYLAQIRFTLVYLHTQIKHKLFSKRICTLHKVISATYL
jgi:hypothetical protein